MGFFRRLLSSAPKDNLSRRDVLTLNTVDDLSKGEPIEWIKETLAEVLHVYRKIGIPLSYIPEIELIDKSFPGLSDSIAFTGVEVPSLKSLRASFAFFFRLSMSRLSRFSEIPNDCVKEFLDVIESKGDFEYIIVTYNSLNIRSKVIYIDTNKIDVILKDRSILRSVLFHEVWHLIELEHNIEISAITEGVATYVQFYFSNKLDSLSSTKIKNPIDDGSFRYIIMGSIIAEYMERRELGITALLDTTIRRNIEQEILNSVIRMGLRFKENSVAEHIKNDYFNPDMIGLDTSDIVTKEELIRAWRESGYVNFANFIAKIDGSRLEIIRGIIQMCCKDKNIRFSK